MTLRWVDSRLMLDTRLPTITRPHFMVDLERDTLLILRLTHMEQDHPCIQALKACFLL